MSPIISAPSRSVLPEAIRQLNRYPEYHPMSGVLHHYTSLDALLLISTSKKLRATSVHYLNDANESELGLALILEAAKKVRHRGESRQNSGPIWMLGYLPACFKMHQFTLCAFRRLVIPSVNGEATLRTGGVCIAMNVALLLKRMQAMGWTFQNCRYQRMSQESWASAIVSRMVRQAKEAAGASEPDEQIFLSVINGALSDILQVAATIKNQSFSEEKEVRFISPMIRMGDGLRSAAAHRDLPSYTARVSPDSGRQYP